VQLWGTSDTPTQDFVTLTTVLRASDSRWCSSRSGPARRVSNVCEGEERCLESSQTSFGFSSSERKIDGAEPNHVTKWVCHLSWTLLTSSRQTSFRRIHDSPSCCSSSLSLIILPHSHRLTSCGRWTRRLSLLVRLHSQQSIRLVLSPLSPPKRPLPFSK
jgi:hypothetical protein